MDNVKDFRVKNMFGWQINFEPKNVFKIHDYCFYKQ